MNKSFLFLRARPGRGADLLLMLERLGVLAVASEQPGFLGVEVAASVDDPDDIVIIGSWASVEHYERWRRGAVSGPVAEQIEGLATGVPEGRVYHVVEAVS